MVVDIEKGDTFGATNEWLWQYRGETMRTVSNTGAHAWRKKQADSDETIVPRDVAFAWIRSLGHEVKHVEQHTAPTPTYPVVRVADCLTHAVQSKVWLGGVALLGTEEQCKRYSNGDPDETIVALDWTGVGLFVDLKPVPIPPSPSPFPRKQPEPLASNANYTLEDARPAPFKVGDVVRGKVVRELLAVRYDNGELMCFGSLPMTWPFYEEDKARANAETVGGTVVRVAVVEVSEGETK